MAVLVLSITGVKTMIRLILAAALCASVAACGATQDQGYISGVEGYSKKPESINRTNGLGGEAASGSGDRGAVGAGAGDRGGVGGDAGDGGGNGGNA